MQRWNTGLTSNLCAAPVYCISCHSCQNVFMPGSCCVIQSGDWNDVFMHELYYVSSHKVGHVRAALFVSVDNKRCAACMFPADFEVSAATLHQWVGVHRSCLTPGSCISCCCARHANCATPLTQPVAVRPPYRRHHHHHRVPCEHGLQPSTGCAACRSTCSLYVAPRAHASHSPLSTSARPLHATSCAAVEQ